MSKISLWLEETSFKIARGFGISGFPAIFLYISVYRLGWCMLFMSPDDAGTYGQWAEYSVESARYTSDLINMAP